MKQCAIEGCERPGVSRRGWCLMHYKRWKRNGDPLALKYAPRGATPEEKLRFKGWDVTEAGCWEFRSYDSGPMGYKQVWLGGADHPAHRVAYEVWVGPIPDGMIVRHKCDNPPCINPDHLEPGTHEDNADDRGYRKRHGTIRLTSNQVVEIRARYALGGETNDSLAREYGVSSGHINAIINMKERVKLYEQVDTA